MTWSPLLCGYILLLLQKLQKQHNCIPEEHYVQTLLAVRKHILWNLIYFFCVDSYLYFYVEFCFLRWVISRVSLNDEQWHTETTNGGVDKSVECTGIGKFVVWTCMVFNIRFCYENFVFFYKYEILLFYNFSVVFIRQFYFLLYSFIIIFIIIIIIIYKYTTEIWIKKYIIYPLEKDLIY